MPTLAGLQEPRSAGEPVTKPLDEAAWQAWSEKSRTASQVEWAERIKRRVNDEFDRVARSFRSVAVKQSHAERADTEAILAILEDKRAEVMSREQAGYFIHDWQEISDQVRLLIFHDARYQAIKARKAAPRSLGEDPSPIPPKGSQIST